MIQQLVVAVVAIFALADHRSTPAAVPVSHNVIKDSLMVATSDSVYALSDPELLRTNDWKTVSVTGDDVVILRPNCVRITKSLGQMSQAEQSLIQNVKNRLNVGRGSSFVAGANINPEGEPAVIDDPNYNDHGHGNVIRNTNTVNGRRWDSGNGGGDGGGDDDDIHIAKPGLAVHSFGKKDCFSIAKTGLPNGIASIHVNKDSAAFVLRDGRVSMKPTGCMSTDEQQLVQQLKAQYNLN